MAAALSLEPQIEKLAQNLAKARDVLGWNPRVGFEELVQMMYENDLKEEQSRAAAAKR